MPLDTYRLHQVERPKNAREAQRADEQAARFAAAVSWPLLAIARAGVSGWTGLPRQARAVARSLSRDRFPRPRTAACQHRAG
jgi:hypothetical protein